MKWNYQLVLQFRFSGPTDFDALIILEDALLNELGNKGLLYGHAAGSGKMYIFIHTNEPQTIFDRIYSSHGSDPMFYRIKAAYRSFGTENFIVLWPKGLKTTFRIK